MLFWVFYQYLLKRHTRELFGPLKICPDSWENINSKNVLSVENEKGSGNSDDYGIFFTSDDVTFGVLYTGNSKEENCLLLQGFDRY